MQNGREYNQHKSSNYFNDSGEAVVSTSPIITQKLSHNQQCSDNSMTQTAVPDKNVTSSNHFHLSRNSSGRDATVYQPAPTSASELTMAEWPADESIRRNSYHSHSTERRNANASSPTNSTHVTNTPPEKSLQLQQKSSVIRGSTELCTKVCSEQELSNTAQSSINSSSSDRGNAITNIRSQWHLNNEQDVNSHTQEVSSDRSSHVAANHGESPLQQTNSNRSIMQQILNHPDESNSGIDNNEDADNVDLRADHDGSDDADNVDNNGDDDVNDENYATVSDDDEFIPSGIISHSEDDDDHEHSTLSGSGSKKFLPRYSRTRCRSTDNINIPSQHQSNDPSKFSRPLSIIAKFSENKHSPKIQKRILQTSSTKQPVSNGSFQDAGALHANKAQKEQKLSLGDAPKYRIRRRKQRQQQYEQKQDDASDQVIELHSWWLRICVDGIQVEGYKMEEPEAIIWHSSKIVERLNATTVKSKNGRVYCLRPPYLVRFTRLPLFGAIESYLNKDSI